METGNKVQQQRSVEAEEKGMRTQGNKNRTRVRMQRKEQGGQKRRERQGGTVAKEGVRIAGRKKSRRVEPMQKKEE